MELSVSSDAIDTISAIVTIIAPGYFAIQAYIFRYARAEKDFSRFLIECVVFGSLIVGIYNFMWTYLLHVTILETLRISYYLPLLVLAWGLGWLAGELRSTEPAQRLARLLKMPDPDDDFLRVQFKKLGSQSLVTVVLKSGEIFSGTPESGSPSNHNQAQRFYFSNIAWYRKDKRGKAQWEDRTGSVIVSTDEILYIETETPLRKS